MKLKVGARLFAAREEKKFNQEEMAKFLGVSQSAYSRFERSEVSVDIEQLTSFAKKLHIPIQEFLPETMTIHGDNHQGQVGILVGNFYSYGERDVSEQLAMKEKENLILKENIELLKEQIIHLKALLEMLKAQ